MPPNDLAVDYVLGELSHEDAATFERRLAGDPELAEEVRRLRATLGLLPFATVTEPPPHLRARVLAAGRASAPARTSAPRRVVWSRFAAAAAAVLALAFGFDAYRVRRDLALERELTATLHEPNVVRSFALAGTGGAYGTGAHDVTAESVAVVAVDRELGQHVHRRGDIDQLREVVVPTRGRARVAEDAIVGRPATGVPEVPRVTQREPVIVAAEADVAVRREQDLREGVARVHEVVEG